MSEFEKGDVEYCDLLFDLRPQDSPRRDLVHVQYQAPVATECLKQRSACCPELRHFLAEKGQQVLKRNCAPVERSSFEGRAVPEQKDFGLRPYLPQYLVRTTLQSVLRYIDAGLGQRTQHSGQTPTRYPEPTEACEPSSLRRVSGHLLKSRGAQVGQAREEMRRKEGVGGLGARRRRGGGGAAAKVMREGEGRGEAIGGGGGGVGGGEESEVQRGRRL